MSHVPIFYRTLSGTLLLRKSEAEVPQCAEASECLVFLRSQDP